MSEIEKKVAEIIETLSGMTVESKDQTLKEDLAFDSLRMVLLLVSLEDGFNIVLDESDMNPFLLLSVRDVIGLVGKYVGEDMVHKNV